VQSAVETIARAEGISQAAALVRMAETRWLPSPTGVSDGLCKRVLR